jgi:hypothetical protein
MRSQVLSVLRKSEEPHNWCSFLQVTFKICFSHFYNLLLYQMNTLWGKGSGYRSVGHGKRNPSVGRP